MSDDSCRPTQFVSEIETMHFLCFIVFIDLIICNVSSINFTNSKMIMLCSVLCIVVHTSGLERVLPCPIQLLVYFVYQGIYANSSEEIMYLIPVSHFSYIM